jgi:hypothetical protein
VRSTNETTFSLPIPPAAALTLFTPEGERRWAGESWDPVYPTPDAERDDGSPGTVFTTESEGQTTVWIVVDRTRHLMRYARVMPGQNAGTVTVTCTPSDRDGECQVTVRYDLTALSEAGLGFVHALEHHQESSMHNWQSEILKALNDG